MTYYQMCATDDCECSIRSYRMSLGKHHLSMSSASSSIAMASNSDTVSDSHTNSLSNRSESHPDNDFTHTELKGWLLKRGRISRKWKKQWFQLKNCDLYYGKTSEVNSTFLTEMFCNVCAAGCVIVVLPLVLYV